MRKNAQHIFAVYKTDYSDLVQSDSIDFSCLFPHSEIVKKLSLSFYEKDLTKKLKNP